MESEKSETGVNDSPSLDSYQQQLLPLSSVDSEDILPIKDVTSQFLLNETNEKIRLYSDESYQSLDANFDSQNKNSNSELNLTSKDSLVQNENDEKEENDVKKSIGSEKSEVLFSEKQDFNDFSENLMGFDSSTHFINFEKTENGNTNVTNNTQKPTFVEENIENNATLDASEQDEINNLLLNDKKVKGLDEFSFTPKKGESSPLLHTKEEKEVTKRSRNEPDPNLTKFILETGLSKEHELLSLNNQGDGFNVREADEGDQSDSNDFIPEPIPKDYPEIGAIEGKQFFAALGLDTWFHPNLLNPKVESLVYWRNPKKSGVVFGSVMVVLLSLTTFSLISVVAYISLIVLGAALGFRIYKNVFQAIQKTSDGHPFKEYLDVDLTLNPDKAREISDLVVSYVNRTVTKCRSLFLVEDIIDSIKFGALLWCLTYVGSWFNGLSLLIIAFVGLFTLPKVYENNKTQIDANLNVVWNKINLVTERIKAVVPVGKKMDESKGKSD